MPSLLKKITKILTKIILSLVVLILILWVLLQTSFFQNFLVHRFTKSLSKSLNTTVTIKHVNFDLFSRAVLENTLILDHQKDTLLYAGALKVNITDWFFLKDRYTLRYVGLEDAVIKLNRTTPEWNYQFLIDYFSGGSSGNNTSQSPDLDLKIISMKNVSMLQQDKWLGRDVLVSVKDLRLEADKLDLIHKFLQINLIAFDQPVFAQYDYTGLRPSRADTTQNPAITDTSSEALNSDNWRVQTKLIKIKDGKVAIEREGETPPTPFQFDERHIILSKLNATLQDTKIVGDTLTSEISFSARDRGGFTIKKLSSHFKMTPQVMEFSKLDIQTEKSHVGDYFAMHYKSFNDDMNDFISAVRMEGHFKNATISSEDLAYFAPDTKDWNQHFVINGNVSGKVEDLTALNFEITSGKDNFLSGDLSMRGLPDINSTFMDLRIRDMKTNYGELTKMIPALKKVTQPDLSSFGNIRYQGSFTGYFNDFVTFGVLSTSIGVLNTDLHLKVPARAVPFFSGKVSTTGFNIGRFLKDSMMGQAAFQGTVSGKGFDEKDMNITFDGTIQKFEYNKYPYTNAVVHGNIRDNYFMGTASINDPAIKVQNLSGTMNFGKKDPFFNFSSEIDWLDLNALRFTNDTVQISGNLNANFTGRNIDDFLGTAQITDAALFINNQPMSFDSLVIHSSIFDNHKILSLNTNELEASINGNFTIRELPKAFQLFLNRYYPGYVQKPEGKIENQSFSFMIHTGSVSDYLTLFQNRLSGLDESVISGNIDIEKGLLELQATIPKLKYSLIALNDIKLNGTGNKDSLFFLTDINDVVINDSLHSSATQVTVNASNDISDIQITSAPNQGFNSVQLSARVETNEEGFRLEFNPSSFTLGQKTWNIQKEGEIQLINDMITAHNVRLYQNGQEIKVSTEPSTLTNDNNVKISITGLIMDDFLPYFLKTPQMKGVLSGDIEVMAPTRKPKFNFTSTITQFRFEGDSIGVLHLKGFYNDQTGTFSSSVVSDNHPYNFTGNFSYNPSDSLSPLDGTVNLNQTDIHILGTYLEGILDSLQGNATGKLSLSGTTANPILSGKINLNQTSMVIDYTQCKYRLADNSVITFNPGEIDFGTINLKDSSNRTATLTGKISHNFFEDFVFNNLQIKTTTNFQLLNTTSRDNSEFYGRVKGQAELSMNGPLSDMRMNIKGQPTDSSQIYLPIGETVEGGGLNYIDFIQFGQEMRPDTKVRKNTNVKVQMDLTANPLAKIFVILDEITGDIIESHGSGKLLITAGTTDPLTIRGRYTVEDGEYTFNFQTFLKTPFTLEGGYIEWQGDPYLAILNIDALYRAKNVSLDNIPTSTGLSNTRGDVDILFKLRGTLKDPSPQFEFQFPFDNPLKSDPIANEYLKTRFQSDNNQLLNQVAALLLFNTFLTTDQGILGGNYTSSFVSRTVGQLLSSTLTNSLNLWLQKLIKTNSVKLYSNLNAPDFNLQKAVSERQLQNLGGVGIRTSFLNNKLIINLGGSVDYSVNPALNNSNSNFLFTPDVSFEYLITPSGNLRVIGFNRSDRDPSNITGMTTVNRTGLQLSYRRDFDTFEEFFTGKKKVKVN